MSEEAVRHERGIRETRKMNQKQKEDLESVNLSHNDFSSTTT